jgi:hypothetical protein
MDTLKDLVKEMKRQQEIANMDLSEVPAEAYTVRKGKVKRAEEDLNTLREKYLEQLRRCTLFIINTGDDRATFAEIAKNEFGCFTKDYNEFYNLLVEDLDNQLFLNKTVGSHIFDIVGRKIEDVALSLGILSYPFLGFENKYKKTVNSREELMKVVRSAVNDKIGVEMVGLYSTFKVAQEAMAEGFDAKMAPIVISVEEDQALELARGLNFMSNNVFMVNNGTQDEGIKNRSIASPEKLTKTTVKQILTDIKSNFR